MLVQRLQGKGRGMARKEENAADSYEKDAFDTPPAGPVGVHRGKQAFSRRAMPFVVVVVIAALAGLLVWGIYSGEIAKIHMPWRSAATSSQPASTPGKSSATAAPSDSQSQTASQSPSDQPSQPAQTSQPAPQQTVNKAAAVQVLNATGVTGYAAQKAAVLTQNGYTSVTAANSTGQIPAASVVWYQNETDQTTAQDVANALGIANVEQSQQIGTPIVVVLLN
jgi:cytoskeletal protein RodZ